MKKKATAIKIISITITIIEIIVGIIEASKLDSFWLFLGIAAAAAITLLYLLSYAELLETVDSMSEKINELQKPKEKQNPETEKMETITKQEDWSISSKKIKICPKCQTTQLENRTICYACGASFESDT